MVGVRVRGWIIHYTYKGPHKDRNTGVCVTKHSHPHTENQLISEVSFIYITPNHKSHFCLQGFLDVYEISHPLHSTHTNQNNKYPVLICVKLV